MSTTNARRPISERRRRLFLEALAQSGSMLHAAAAASPHSRTGRRGYESFRDLIRRDPQFAARVAVARDEALGRVEREIFRRAVEGTPRPVFQKGELAGHETVYSDRLLEGLAARLDPQSWTPGSKVDVSGRVEHSGVMLQITPADVLLLAERDQATLVGLLTQIAETRENDGPGVPALPAGTQAAD